MLYCTNYYYFCTENDTPPHSLVSSQTDPAQPCTSGSPSSGPPSNRKRNSWNQTSDSALGWSFLDQQPSLSQVSNNVAELQQWMTPPHHLIYFLFSSQKFMIKHIKTETNRNAKSIADKHRRTNKLKPHRIWRTWTRVRVHKMYLFFAVIIHVCVVKKPKLSDFRSTSNNVVTATRLKCRVWTASGVKRKVVWWSVEEVQCVCVSVVRWCFWYHHTKAQLHKPWSWNFLYKLGAQNRNISKIN